LKDERLELLQLLNELGKQHLERDRLRNRNRPSARGRYECGARVSCCLRLDRAARGRTRLRNRRRTARDGRGRTVARAEW